MVKIACLDNAFSEVSELEANPVEGQSWQQKDKKKRKRKGQKAIKQNQKAYRSHNLSKFSMCMLEQKIIVIKCDTRGTKGMLSCFKCPLE